VGALKLWEMFTHAVKRGEEQGEELCTPALQKQERLGGSNREDTWPYCCRPDGTYSDVAAFVNALCEGELSKCRKQEQEEEEERQFLLPAKGGGAAAMRMHPPPGTPEGEGQELPGDATVLTAAAHLSPPPPHKKRKQQKKKRPKKKKKKKARRSTSPPRGDDASNAARNEYLHRLARHMAAEQARVSSNDT
jgi:hypothetical protein